MRGVNPEVESVLETLSQFSSLTHYTLIGGTALSLQIGHRLSEDLDFCLWGKDRPFTPDDFTNELQDAFGLGNYQLLLNADLQKDYLIKGSVKVTIFNDVNSNPPTFEKNQYYQNVRIADIYSIAGMKACVSLQRAKYRDYFDLFSICYKHLNVRDVIASALDFKPFYNSRMIAMNIAGLSEVEDEKISLLRPIYQITHSEINSFFRKLLTPAGVQLTHKDLERHFEVRIDQSNRDYHSRQKPIELKATRSTDV